MEMSTALTLVAVLIVALWGPFFYLNRRGKARGHTWFTWWKPRGHSDIGPDLGVPQTRPGADDAQQARY